MTTLEPMPQLLTIADFCERYRISQPTLYRIVSRGDLVMVKVGRSSRIRFDEAERWAAALPASQRGA